MAALLTLNGTALRNRVAELGLRQWWLAEQLNLDRRTVLRWLNGQVRSIAPDRADYRRGLAFGDLLDAVAAEAWWALGDVEGARAAAAAPLPSRPSHH
jgi:hypothetical protein